MAFLILMRNDDRERKCGTADVHRESMMKQIHLNKYVIAAILLMAAATIFIAIALTTNPGEFVTAAFVISGMICAISGIFTLTFSGGEPVDPRLVGLLPAQGHLNLCRIASDLGITGNAYFLPPHCTGETQVMQFNPTLPYNGITISAKRSFPTPGPGGLVTLPTSTPLIQDLRMRNGLVIPHNEDQLTKLLRETITEIFEFAPRVSVRWQGSNVTVTLHRYRFIAGCQLIARESPGCCARNPCVPCSLCGALLAEGTDKVIALDQCSLSVSGRDVNLVFLILPVQNIHP
jgi:hypothetical protein